MKRMLPIYRNIRQFAKDQGMPIYILERKAGLSAGSVNHWNNVSPTVASLKKVADVLGVTLDVLAKE